ncbi:GspE/PulE family protein [Vallitalea okinawensis]|uniref:GspE/PulE family protein n=1 Tax=Vallitalea okinawensis TaxID=2078660 RepID=UPI000CFCF70D|nr:GspE/PulE family protein [Vallitalea okinawensis]
MKRKKLGELLIDAVKIDQKSLEEAVSYQKIHNCKIGKALVALQYITDQEIIETLSKQLSVPLVSLEKEDIKQPVVKLVPQSVAKKYNIIPFRLENNILHIAVSNPYNMEARDDVRLITRKSVKIHLCSDEEIEEAIDRYYKEGSSKEVIEELVKELDDNSTVDEIIENDDIANAPTVKIVNSIITQAIRMKASDIHIEPFDQEIFVRNRINGSLTKVMSIPIQSFSAISTRIKLLADMNIAEKRVPQDGRIETEVDGKKFDLRVSALPTTFGEKIVMRILHRNASLLAIEHLGFTDEEKIIINRFTRIPYGIVLVSGPTGSGKTTTLYAMLKELNTVDKNLVTVEDPVEYMFTGINQVQVNTKAGLTFAEGLRSILRQDPDIIMVGEIRDEETAEISVRSAITGHMVLSTIHTNDAASTITRLLDMGIPSYLVADAIVGVIAQRLVRRLCPHCKNEVLATNMEKITLKVDQNLTIFKPIGCHICNWTGYTGRSAIHEILDVSDKIKAAIAEGKTTQEINNLAVNEGMDTLFESCKRLVLKGETSIEEMTRVVFV